MEPIEGEQDILVVDEKAVTSQVSFQRLSETHQPQLLTWAVKLANHPGFQSIVREERIKTLKAESYSEVKDTIESIKEKALVMKMENEIEGRGAEQLSEWFPGGAIEPAIDAVWQLLGNKLQQ